MTTNALGRVAGYVYRDNAYCPDCIGRAATEPWGRYDIPRVEVEGLLDGWAARAGIDRDRPRSFSSRVFPDRLYAAAIDEPWVCETCRKEIR